MDVSEVQSKAMVKDENAAMESQSEDKSSTNFIYMDMSVYNEEDESDSGTEIKQEMNDDSLPSLNSLEADKSNAQNDHNFPLHSIKNLDNSTDDKHSKRAISSSRSISAQKENILGVNGEENNLEISEQKRYQLRNRKNVSFREDDLHYFYNELEKQLGKKKRNGERKIRRTKTFCEKCGEIFNSETALKKHENSCEKLTCDICREIFFSKTLIIKHMNLHFNEGSPKCLNCSEIFENFESLDKHECKEQKFTCEVCQKNFKQLEKLKIHLLWHQGVNYKCGKCYKSFISQEVLDEHAKTVDCAQFVHQCGKCGKIYRDATNFKKHMDGHKNNVMKCNNCKKVFIDGLKFSEHIEANNCKKAMSKKKCKYECDACGSKFVRLVKLQIHILNVHHGINYQCDKCLVKFPSQEDYDTHISKQDCKAEDPSTCKICGKIFAKRDYLKKHQYMHSNVLFKCKYCYCAFMKEKSYKRHMERMNCSKSARKIRLAEFNYKNCRICNVEFESEEILINHFNMEHPNENPHQCFCCESRLPNSKEFQNHIHQHNIQKYTCNLCGKPYTSQEGFRKHRLKHKGAEFKCKFCESEFLNESRFKFHVKTCKKNPDSGYEPSMDKPKKKKDDKPKQSRQLHWESRIIMKHLRGDPKSAIGPNDNSIVSTFFDEPDTDSKNSERGWFDNYYKTEEDDIAFGLRKDSNDTTQDYESDFDVTEFLQSGSIVKKKKNSASPQPPESDNDDNNQIESSSEESSDGSSEEEIEDIPIDYNPKKCRICVITFGQEYELLHHFIKSHPNQHAHKCPNCEFEGPLFAQLKEHMKTHGIGMGVYNCDNCSKKFKSEKKWKSHNIRCKGMELETEKVQIQNNEDFCKKCGKKFQTKCGYRRHKQLCKGKSKKTKKTNLSKPKIEEKSEDEIETSKPLSDSEEEPPQIERKPEPEPEPEPEPPKKDLIRDIGEPPIDSFPCRLCDKKFQYERGIVMHFKSDHPGHKALICYVCNMHLADKLKEHLKTHGIGEEFICELCGKRFNQKFLSKIHEMWHQGIEYKCSNCKQKFLNKEKMDKHISENRCSNRQSLMRLPCSICGKSYRSKFGLSKHYITHTPKELRPVKNRMNCEYCGKWFENNNGLQRHRRIHTGERPFCCRFCPKAFAQEGNCKAHERIHTGESKPRKKKNQNVEVAPYPSQLNFYLCGNNFDPNTIVQ